MIVKLKFKAKVKDCESMVDSILIQVESIKVAKHMFKEWLIYSAGIKGDSGIFHPLGIYGKIKLVSIKEKHEHRSKHSHR